jgi:hypothetical protein
MDSENETPYAPLYAIEPTNFRSVIQRSIERHVDKNIDISMTSAKTGIDGRFGISFPVAHRKIVSPKGYSLFIVGASVVNCATVAGP